MQTSRSDNSLATKNALGTIQAMFERRKGALAAIAPKHLTPERLIRLVLSAASRTPKLLECTPESLLLSTLQAASLGLEPNTPLGLCYLIPRYNGRTRKMEATFLVGYRGLVRLAAQSGEVKSFQAFAVYANDVFEVEFGLEPKLVHRPNFKSDPGELIAVYAVAQMTGDAVAYDVMRRAEIDRIRDLHAAKDRNDKVTGPWVSDYVEMAKKTVIRRLAKTLPLVTERSGFQKAVEMESRSEAGEPIEALDIAAEPSAEVDAALEEAKAGQDAREVVTDAAASYRAEIAAATTVDAVDAIVRDAAQSLADPAVRTGVLSAAAVRQAELTKAPAS